MSNGINVYVIENIPRTTRTSWKTAETAPNENCQFLNLNNIYRKTMINEPNTAKKEFFLISSAIVGPTPKEDIIPTCFSSLPLTKSFKLVSPI